MWGSLDAGPGLKREVDELNLCLKARALSLFKAEAVDTGNDLHYRPKGTLICPALADACQCKGCARGKRNDLSRNGCSGLRGASISSPRRTRVHARQRSAVDVED